MLVADAYGRPTAPSVLLIHGGGQTRHAWTATASRLAAIGWYAVAIDQRGHGDSDWDPEGRYTLSDFSQDLSQVVSELPNSPVLIGASLGGIAALMMSTETTTSEACRALILVDVTPRLALSGVLRILSFMRAYPEGFSSLEEAAQHVASYLPHRQRPVDSRGLGKNLRLGDDGRYRWHWDPRLLDAWDPQRFTPEVSRQLVEERLARASMLSVPTLLVRGRMSDVVAPEHAKEFLQACPHAEYVDLAGAAHMVAGDRNDTFCASIIDFLARHALKGQPRVEP